MASGIKILLQIPKSQTTTLPTKSTITVKYETHNYATHTLHNIHHPKTQHEYVKCIRFNIRKVINSSPNDILNKITTHSLQGFSGYIKQYILYSYEENCHIRHCYIYNR